MSLTIVRFQITTLVGVTLALSMSACDGDGTGTGGQGGGTTTTDSGGGGVGGTGGDTGGTPMTGGGGAGGTGGSMGGTGGMGGGGGNADCENLPSGPFDPVLVVDVFNGSEDLAFDGKGRIAAKDGQTVILSDAMGQTTTLAMNVPAAYGLRYRPDGFLVVALPNAGKVIEISPAGVVADYATGLSGPNGLYPDEDGNVWVTELGGNQVSRINPDKTVDLIVSGNQASSANGVVLDKTRNLLFYTNYGSGRIRSVDLSAGGNFTGVEVIQIPNTNPDGLLMDACGNLYVVDQGNSDLYRVRLDAAGAAVGQAEMLASFPKNVANAQFGSGPGFDPQTIYAAGNPGSVYAIAVGVAGAEVPTPP